MTNVSVSEHGTIYLLAMQFAASATFQSILDVTTQDAAFAFVHYPDVSFFQVGDEVVMTADLRPPRIVIADELGDFELEDGGIHEFRTPLETFWVAFDFYVPLQYADVSTKNAWAWFRSNVLKIIKEARDLGKTGNVGGLGVTYPTIQAARRVEGPYCVDHGETELDSELDDPAEESPGQLWHCAFEIVRGT